MEAGRSNLYEVVARYFYDNYFTNRVSNTDTWELNSVFLTELGKFEYYFNLFLLDQTRSNSSYQDKASKLFLDIAQKGTPNPEIYFINTSVLSFNYTEPEFRLDEPHETVHTVNIHGSLGGDIIIGLDGKNRMDNELAVPFTKTYRLMSQKRRERYDSDYSDHSALICGKVDAIKFYGHSLSEADYSYFQAMFDATNLYGGSTVLAFYYQPCSQSELAAVRTGVMKNVTSLLTTYGATLDNKDHGNNLIHKLLIEDRLFVECVR